jgi:hypothetical protein
MAAAMQKRILQARENLRERWRSKMVISGGF